MALSLGLPGTREEIKATECPQDFSAELHPLSSLLLQRIAADFELK